MHNSTELARSASQTTLSGEDQVFSCREPGDTMYRYLWCSMLVPLRGRPFMCFTPHLWDNQNHAQPKIMMTTYVILCLFRVHRLTWHTASTCITKRGSTKKTGKNIRVFLSGDYEFLCNIFGLSGAAGTSNTSVIIITHVGWDRSCK